MNSLDTAITFASSIASLTLPSIVTDFFPQTKDNVTPLKNIAKIFTTILGVVPFVGPISTAANAVNGGTNFVLSKVNPPAQTDLFLKWSDISASLATVVQSYQTAVSTYVKATLDAQIGATGAIDSVIYGGHFLGIAQNFSPNRSTIHSY